MPVRLSNTAMVCLISSGLYCGIPAHQIKTPRDWPGERLSWGLFQCPEGAVA
jgi:hypothetical protein